MVVVSYSGKEINAKLVYYGPGLCGKTTNLENIYDSIPSTLRGKMVSMKTRTERTLFFDFLPVDLGELGGFKTRFLLYTVPGQVYYNATRKLVLRGVDAVVFVADSARGKMNENLESLENLRENLTEYGLDLATIPWVLQFNKRDLPDTYSIEEMNQALNPGNVPWFEAVATNGTGVFDTLKGVSKLLLDKLSKEIKLTPKTADPLRPPTGRPSGTFPAPTMTNATPTGTTPATPSISLGTSMSGTAPSPPAAPPAPPVAATPTTLKLSTGTSIGESTAMSSPPPPTPQSVVPTGSSPSPQPVKAPAPAAAQSRAVARKSAAPAPAPSLAADATRIWEEERPGFGTKMARMFGFGRRSKRGMPGSEMPPIDRPSSPQPIAQPAAAPRPPMAAVVTSGSSTRISRVDPAPAYSPAEAHDESIERRVSVPVSVELTPDEIRSGARLRLVLDIDLTTMQATVEREAKTGTR